MHTRATIKQSSFAGVVTTCTGGLQHQHTITAALDYVLLASISYLLPAEITCPRRLHDCHPCKPIYGDTLHGQRRSAVAFYLCTAASGSRFELDDGAASSYPCHGVSTSSDAAAEDGRRIESASSTTDDPWECGGTQ